MALVPNGIALPVPAAPIKPDDPANMAVAIYNEEGRLHAITRGYPSVYAASAAFRHAFPSLRLTLAVRLNDVDLSAL